MKHIVAILACFTVMFTPAESHAQTSDRYRLCPKIGELAKTIMTARQSGTAMSIMIEFANESPIIKDMVITMIKMAYDVPRYSSHEYRQSAVDDFRITAEKACYK